MATYNADPGSVELLKAMGLDHTDAVDCLKAGPLLRVTSALFQADGGS